jgi:hypothetical protein
MPRDSVAALIENNHQVWEPEGLLGVVRLGEPVKRPIAGSRHSVDTAYACAVADSVAGVVVVAAWPVAAVVSADRMVRKACSSEGSRSVVGPQNGVQTAAAAAAVAVDGRGGALGLERLAVAQGWRVLCIGEAVLVDGGHAGPSTL